MKLSVAGILGIAPVICFTAAALMVAAADETRWGYAGDGAPASWGKLAPEFTLCGEGMAQSPIDIRNAIEAPLVDIEFQFDESANNIFNNGHTIQVEVDAGSAIVYNGIRYDLLQFHFHAPSEHTINGEAAALEVHFVHRDPNSGNLAVVGILMIEGEAANEAYAPVFDNMPVEVSEPQSAGERLDMAALLPSKRSYYTYNGSLTTPPCSEIVRWLLLDAPVTLSAGQIAAFQAIYANNARPVQPLGKRDLLRDAQ